MLIELPIEFAVNTGAMRRNPVALSYQPGILFLFLIKFHLLIFLGSAIYFCGHCDAIQQKIHKVGNWFS